MRKNTKSVRVVYTFTAEFEEEGDAARIPEKAFAALQDHTLAMLRFLPGCTGFVNSKIDLSTVADKVKT